MKSMFSLGIYFIECSENSSTFHECIVMDSFMILSKVFASVDQDTLGTSVQEYFFTVIDTPIEYLLKLKQHNNQTLSMQSVGIYLLSSLLP